MTHFTIITLFPDFFESPLQSSILKRASEEKIFSYSIMDLREYGLGNYRQVDDTPYGGGAGMVLRPEPLFAAISDAKKRNNGPVINFTPQGKKWTQPRAEQFGSKYTNLILICGHYEGIDYRIREHLVDYEFSIGNYVVTGGELPALIMIDSLVRLLPGALGDEDSHTYDSFSKAFGRKKEYPVYTKPAEFNGWKVPKILTSGNHKEIELWKNEHLL